MDTIIVPVDGATNIKLEVFDFETLERLYSESAPTPVRSADGLEYNATAEQFAWYDSVIRSLPGELKRAKVVAPAARGASGGLVGPDNTLLEAPGQGLTLAYTQEYPAAVEKAFRKLAPDEREFFLETGSVRDFPGSLTLLKRLLFEELERPRTLNRAAYFGTYGALLAGHFLADDYLTAVRKAGNEHSYWMCHTGARDIRRAPGAPSSICRAIKSFSRLVPAETARVYEPLGLMPEAQAAALGLSGPPLVIPGGHDTCLSHIPLMSTFYQAFKGRAGTPVFHLEAGSWTMFSFIGAAPKLPPDGYERDILVQGTVDGGPVVTARYGGGRDFRHLAALAAERGLAFEGRPEESLLVKILNEADCFALPNIDPANRLTGPFPRLQGKIVNENSFFRSGETAHILADLSVAITSAGRLADLAPKDRSVPVVLSGGGSRDALFGRLLATLSGQPVYALFDQAGNPLSETASLGAAIAGKAACLGCHPYRVDSSRLGVSYAKLAPFKPDIAKKLAGYRERFLRELGRALK